MSGPPRKVPRIMAKSSRIAKAPTILRTATVKSDAAQTVEDVPIRTNDLDDDHEQLLVRDGVVVGLQQPNGRFVDETGLQVPTSVVHSNPRTRRIVIESTSENSREYEPYVPTTLPGVADEVESYPCPLCPDRVFLTSFGLERHSTENHQEHLQEILDHIEAISAEWRRREEELARRRERVYAARLRQETITRHAIEQVSNGTLMCSSSGEESAGGDGADVGERRFKACNLCGILVDADSSAAMESHLRAHKKNDDLKLKLLARYGPEEVGRLMCNECNMVFGDECSLIVHNQQMHTRRRKYVCKWCGHVAYTMTELNVHKADVHAMPPFTTRSDRDRILRRRHHQQGRGLIALGANPRNNEIDDRHGSATSSNSDVSFRTTCEQCGLRLVRPSLLIRHMLRAHSKRSFSCEIEAPGYCNYRIDVNSERITWTCCNTQFSNRREFYLHRVNTHLEKLVAGAECGGEYQTYQDSINPNGALAPGAGVCVENADGTSYMGRIETGPDGTMQVVVPHDIMNSNSDFYVVIEDDTELEGQSQFKCVEGASQQIDQIDQEQPQLQMHPDQNLPSSDLLGEILVEEPVDENEGQMIAITEEQYEQLRLQYGDDLENMSVIYVDDTDVGKNEMVGDVNEPGVPTPPMLRS